MRWLDEPDTYVTSMGAKGLGEVGTAAIADAVHHATGIRVRDLPIILGKLDYETPKGWCP